MNTKIFAKSLFLIIFFSGYVFSFNSYEQSRYRTFEALKSIENIDNSLQNIDRRMREYQFQKENDYFLNSIINKPKVSPVKLNPVNYSDIYKDTALDHNSGYEPEFLKLRRANEKNIKEAGDAFINHFFK